jgi:hypothetical protein
MDCCLAMAANGTLVPMEFMSPWTLCHHGLDVTMNFMSPWTLCHHGLYIALEFGQIKACEKLQAWTRPLSILSSPHETQIAIITVPLAADWCFSPIFGPFVADFGFNGQKQGSTHRQAPISSK